jgi:uncharacterized protein (TIGR03437 family)
MRCKGFVNSIAIAAFTAGIAVSATTGFGTVVPIGGTASDIVLDSGRGVLYIANFGGNTIQVMSTASNSIQTSYNVAPNPISMSESPDGQWLLIAHYGNWTASDPNKNLITLIHLADSSQVTYNTFDPPLGVAFVNNGQALIVTTTSFLLFNPASGQMAVVATLANLATALPVNQATFPGQISETALTPSADGSTVWGIGGAGTGTQVIYQYNARSNTVSAETDVSSPPLLPRVSVASDGSSAMIGWALFSNQGYIAARYPNVITSPNITGSVIDSKNGIIYGQFPDASQPTGPPAASSASPAGTASSTNLPAILIMSSDNLTVQDRIVMPENMVGRAILNSAATTIYAISDSGVMVLPVGNLNQYHRLAAAQEDVLIQTNFCNTSSVVQTLTITDPGGGNTDFTITPSQSGVTVSPASGVTPATVQIRVNPTVLVSTGGTAVVTLTLSSQSAVNQPRPVRLLVNNPDLNQRGTIVNVPGTLTDVLPDPARNRFYILRQDKNQLQVYDANTTQLITTLRTATTPSMMALTIDGNYLLVGHNDSQLITMYDLTALQPTQPIVLPGGHYARSIAASNGALLVLARNEGTGTGTIDTITLANYSASALPSLGNFINSVSPTGILSPSPNGSTIMMASPNGNVMLYSASANTFTVSRQDLTSLSGAFASSAYNSYVVGNYVFNASLVPQGTISTSGAMASGFYFMSQGGYLVTATTASGPGIIQNLASLPSSTVAPTSMVEAPLLPTAPVTVASSSSSSSSSSGSSSASSGTVPTSGNGSGSTSLYTQSSFTRTVAPFASNGTIIVLTTSGFTVLPANYGAATVPPQISSVVNAADGTQPVAPGGLISVYGQQLSPVNMATSQIPLPTALGESCLVVNGAPMPLLFVSSQQINGQLPFNVIGSSTMSIHTPAGISNNFLFSVLPAAPAVFQTGSAGPESGLATIVRADNNELVTPTNPIHPKDTVVIYLTGMGMTFPQVTAGLAAPSSPLAAAVITPVVTLGGVPLSVTYSGLTPNSVGLYQIDAYVPDGVPQGLTIPLVVSQGGSQTTLNVRVVTP